MLDRFPQGLDGRVVIVCEWVIGLTWSGRTVLAGLKSKHDLLLKLPCRSKVVLNLWSMMDS